MANVTGPASSTDTAIARWNGTTGTVIEDSTCTIDGSGNMVVQGKLSPNTYSSQFDGFNVDASGNISALSLTATGADGITTTADMSAYSYSLEAGFFSVDSGGNLFCTSIAQSSTSSFTIDSSGNITGHALGIGESAPSAGNVNISGQYQVGGNQIAAANLSDYVGKTSWTPVLKFGGATTGITYSSQEGTYVQIGKLVIAEMQIALTSKGSATGAVTITGWPVSANSTGAGQLSFYGATASGSNFASPVSGYLDGTTMTLAYHAATGQGALTNSDFTNTTQINLTCVYIAS